MRTRYRGRATNGRGSHQTRPNPGATYPKKWMTCIGPGCSRPMYTDIYHRICGKCQRRIKEKQTDEEGRRMYRTPVDWPIGTLIDDDTIQFTSGNPEPPKYQRKK